MTTHPIRQAMDDFRLGVFDSVLWAHLAWQDIKQRYRRSIIGPFWMTLSTAAMILAMGPLYGALLHQEVGSYVQHLAVSLVVWLFIASCINESCMAYIAAEGFIKQVKLPLSTHVLRVLGRNVIIFAHNLPVVMIVLFIYPPTSLAALPLAVLGFALVAYNLSWIGVVLATLCARFRDIPQIVASVIQVAFFLTPVVWRAETAGVDGWVADANPLYHLVELIRAPLLGRVPAVLSWGVVCVLAIVGTGFTAAFFARFRARVPYWV